MKYKLNPFFRINISNDGNLIISNANNYCEQIVDNVFFWKKLFKQLSIDSDILIIQKNLIKNNIDIELDDLSDILKDLIKKNIVKEKIDPSKLLTSLSHEELLKYDRQLNSFEILEDASQMTALKTQEKLKAKKVVILGIGGVGSYIAYSLVAMGIGSVTLVDFDKVEISNTSRQMLYDETNVGSLKIEVAKNKLSKINKFVKINTINKKINTLQDLEKIITNEDLLIFSADEPRGIIQKILSDYNKKTNFPILLGSPSSNQVIVGPLITNTKRLDEILSLEDFGSKDDSAIKEINECNFISSIIDPYNGLAGKIMALEAIKYLTKFQPCCVMDKSLILDTSNYSINFI